MDVGMEVMHQLCVKCEPLTDEQIAQYCVASKKEAEDNVEARREYLMRMVDLLSRCKLPIPIDIMAQVCRVSRAQIAKYNNTLMEKLCDKALRSARKDWAAEMGEWIQTPKGTYWKS